MITQRILRYQKKKIIGGNLFGNVYDKVKNVISMGSKIIDRIPSSVKKLAAPLLLKEATKAIERGPVDVILKSNQLNDRSRAILSNLITGSGFKNYIT